MGNWVMGCKAAVARRDEDFDLGSRMLAMVGCESDDFLGQCLLPLSTLSGESELWCNLGEPSASASTWPTPTDPPGAAPRAASALTRTRAYG